MTGYPSPVYRPVHLAQVLMTMPPMALISELHLLRNFFSIGTRYQGNIGLLRFRDGFVYSKATFFAASYQIIQDLRDAVRYSGLQNVWCVTITQHREEGAKKASKRFSVYTHEIDLIQEYAEVFAPIFKPSIRDRNHDSEYLLLNSLQHYIDQKPHANVDQAELITELFPCSSCAQVIVEFLDKNPQLHLQIYHVLPRNQTSPSLAHPRLTLTQIASSIPPWKPRRLTLRLADSFTADSNATRHFGLRVWL